MKANVYNQKAEKVGDIELSSNIFEVEANNTLVHQAMLAQMGNERQVLAHTKDRSEVRGGGKKPWRQKGTGRARAGSSRSPIWIGGGVTFGPRNDRNFKKNINKKMRQKAIFMVLSDRAKNEGLVVLNNLQMEEYKTKAFNVVLKNIEKNIIKNDDKAKRSILVVNDKKDEKVKFSGRNLVGVKMINLENINVLDLLKYKNLVVTEEVIQNLEKIYKK